MKKYKVLFCDMDGTLIETASGETFPKGIWDMKFKFDVLDAIKNLNPKEIFIVTNQGGIEKGLLPESIQIYDLYIFKQASLWVFKYIDVEDETLHSETMPRLIDAAYYMLCWCIEKGYVKIDKEVKDGRKEN